MKNNLKAAKIAYNIYLAKVKTGRRTYLAHQISEAYNQQEELFHIVCDLSGVGHHYGPLPSISCKRLAPVFKSKVQAICQDLESNLETVDQPEMSSASAFLIRLTQFQPVTLLEMDKVLDRCCSITSSLEPCPAWLIKVARPVTTE